MELSQTISLQDGKGNVIELPLINILRIIFTYLKPLKSEWETEQAKDIRDFSRKEAVLDEFFDWLKEKVGIKKGDSVLL